MRVVDLLRVKVSSCELGDLHEGSWQVLSQFDANRFKQMGEAILDETMSIGHDVQWHDSHVLPALPFDSQSIQSRM